MPIIYLSPSTQENNLYVNGGTEEEWMNRLADAMEPYLTASGIRYSRNTPDMTAASSIRASNAGNYDLHLALHSNAAPEGSTVRSVEFWCSTIRLCPGAAGATLVADGLKTLYHCPTGYGRSPLPPSERYAVSALPPSFLSWATTTTRTMLRGLKTIWRPWPATSCSP